MPGSPTLPTIVVLFACLHGVPVGAQEPVLGATVDGLLAYARTHNPELAAMQAEADASGERVIPAGALPDPRFRMELRDITKFGEQNPTLSPSRVGSTKYLVSQEIPWFGKRDLKRDVAELERESAQGRASATWSEIAARIKASFAQRYYVQRSERLTGEILDLMQRIEKIALVRYKSGLASLQDVIRAQVEQTRLRNERVALETERHHLHTRLNALLGRPPAAPLVEAERLRPLPAAVQLDFATLEARVLARSPLLAADTSKLKAAEKGRELAYKNRYPDFAVGFGPIQYQNEVKEWEVMVEMNLPLQQSSRRAQEREAEAVLAAARARREASSRQLLAELADNLAAIDGARRSEALASNDLLPEAELSFKAALGSYETGKLDFATLLEAQRQIRQARQEQLKAQAEGQMRLADVERLLGEDL
ncbi:MAG: TolC family protein [Dokdonella sp.]|nr:MAG: TolC family protein [Dokdonella sp.]